MSSPAALRPPLPVVNPLTKFFWDGIERRQLLILRCTDCGHFVHLPRPVCNVCLSERLVPSEVSGRGVLYTYTVTVQAFHPYYVDKVPYTLAIVELEEQVGLRFTTQIIDCPEAELRVGLPVELAWTEVAPAMVLPYVRPAP
jgi:uncharacterized OB-fold protein